MAAVASITTPNLKIKFWKQSFRVLHNSFMWYLGREITRDERERIATELQSLVDYGRLGAMQYNKKVVYESLDDAYLINELAVANERIEELEQSVCILRDELDWWINNATSDQEEIHEDF